MKYICVILFLTLLAPVKGSVNGCNFGITNTLIVGATHSYTIGQGAWGPRKYTWTWGDGSSPSISYSTPNNFTSASHTFSNNGVYTFTVNSCDSASGAGCLSYGIYTLSVSGLPTAIIENNLNVNLAAYPNPFNDRVTIENAEFDQVEVRNCIGQIVISETFSTVNNYKLNTAHLYSGVYFICILNDRKLLKVFKSHK